MRNNHHGGPRGVYGGGYGGPHDPRLNYGAHHNQYPINLSENESIKSNSSNKKKSDDELQVFVGGLESVSKSLKTHKVALLWFIGRHMRMDRSHSGREKGVLVILVSFSRI